MRNVFTKLRASFFAAAVFCFLGTLLSVSAQTLPPQQDPLKKILAAGQAAGQNGACSASGESLCEEAAPKIIANALGPSPLYENLRRVTDEIGGRQTGSPAM